LLLRADLPGRHTLGALPNKAVLDVGRHPGSGTRCCGILRETTELQSVGLLIEVSNAPGGLGPGARVPVALLTADRKGLLLPRDALLYDENGAYVYKQLANKTGAQQAALCAGEKCVYCFPTAMVGLVEGVDDDDNIVRARGGGFVVAAGSGRPSC